MKKILPIILSLLCVYANATNYYVSSVSGDDLNAGTLQFPWKTATKASSMNFAAGDKILFAGGEPIIGVITLHNSGAVGNPITYSSYGTGHAISNGLKPVTAWTYLGNNIWESTSQVSNLADCNMVLVNGVNTPMGRYPNTGWLHVDSYTGKTSITSTSLNAATINWTGADVVFKPNHFSLERDLITSQSGSTIFYNQTSAEVFSDGNGFFIENDIRTLDQTNEWFYNSVTKKIDIYSPTMPSNVQVSTMDTLVYGTQKSNITISNIDFIGANRRAIYAGSIQNLTIINCTFDFMGLYAFWGGNNWGLTSNNFVFAHNTVNHTNSQGMKLSSDYTNAKIKYNSFKNIGLFYGMFKSPNLVYGNPGEFNCISTAGTDGLDAEYNTMDSSGYCGILANGLGMTIQYNQSSHNLLRLMDGGCIFIVLPNTSRGTKILHNMLHDCIGDIGGTSSGSTAGFAIYLDIHETNIEVAYNSCFNNSYGFGMGLDDSCNVHDNTFYNNSYTQFFTGGNLGFGEMRSNTLVNNKMISKDASQRVYVWWDSTLVGAKTLFSLADNNYLARPIDDNTTLRLVITDNFTTPSKTTYADYSLAGWQANLSPYEANSHKSPVAITSTGQLSFYYNADSVVSTVTLPAGTSYIDITGTPYSGSFTLQPFSSVVLISNGSLVTPVITWPTPADIVYGTPLSSTQLDATTTVAGTFAYNYAIGTILDAKSGYVLTTTFTPSDPTKYTSATASVLLNVRQQTATLSYSSPTLSQQYTGSPLAVTVITSPSGLSGVSTLYNGVSQNPTSAGSYSLNSGLSNVNYTAASITGTFTITPKPGTFTVSNTSYIYDSLFKTVSVQTSDPRITYTISGAPQRYKGSYPVTVHCTNTNFSVPDVTVTLTISAGIAPALSWTPANMTYNAALGAAQLNAGDANSGSYVYTPAAGFVPGAGSLQLKVDFYPSDTNLAPILGTTRTITVNKGTDVIAVSDTVQFYDGAPKPITVTTTYGGTVTVVYDGSTTIAPSSVGDHPFTATYSDPNRTATPVSGTLHIVSSSAAIYMTNYSNRVYTGSPIVPTVNCAYPYTLSYNPSNHTNVNSSIQVIATINDGIHVGADTVIMSIIKATPTGSWPAIQAGTYPYVVSSSILNATTSVPGTGSYNINIGDTLVPNTYNLTYSFTPTDALDYNSIVLNNTLIVNKGVASISITNTSKQYNGQVQYATVTTNPANLDSLVVTYTGNHKDAGSYPITAQLFSNLYTSSTATGTLTISKGSYQLSWTTPAPMQQGTAISSTQENATSTIPGVFVYNYPAGYIVQSDMTLTGTFYPTDSVNYSVQTISVYLSVYGNPILNHGVKKGKTVGFNL